MSIINALSRIARDLRARRRRAATIVELSSLPLDIRKDIGWPDPMERQPARPKRRA